VQVLFVAGEEVIMGAKKDALLLNRAIVKTFSLFLLHFYLKKGSAVFTTEPFYVSLQEYIL